VSAPSLARGLSPVRSVLPNNVVTIAQQNVAAPAVSINLAFRAGSLHDPGSLPGLSYFTSLVVDRGTSHRSADAIAEELDDRGVSLRLAVSRHSFALGCTCLTEDFSDLLALISDIVRHPTFPSQEVEKRRAEAVTAVRQDADSTATRSVETLMTLLYGADHPYARPARGTVGSLAAIRREDLLAFHARHVVPAGLRVVVAGDITPEVANAEVARLFSDWDAPRPGLEIVPPARAAAGRQVEVIPMPGKAQSDISYGFAAIRRLDPRYYGYWLLNNILGEFGLGGRLADNIRERQGMAYYAFSALDASVGEGQLVVRAGVDPKNVRRTIDAIDGEVLALATDGPSAKELEESRDALIGSIPRMLETNEGIADFLQTAEFFGLGLDYDRQLPELLGAVTLHDVARAARELLDVNRAAIAIAGPHDDGPVAQDFGPAEPS
jgi:zinc protease